MSIINALIILLIFTCTYSCFPAEKDNHHQYQAINHASTQSWSDVTTDKIHHDAQIIITSNVPVLYLDSISEIIDMICEDDIFEIQLTDTNALKPFIHQTVLLVLGEFQYICSGKHYPFRASADWKIDELNGRIFIKTTDPKKKRITGTYHINVDPSDRMHHVKSRYQRLRSQISNNSTSIDDLQSKSSNSSTPQIPSNSTNSPQQHQFDWPLSFDIDVNKTLSTPDKKINIKVNPLSVHASAKITMTIKGELFKPDMDIHIKFTGQMKSLFNFDVFLTNQTDQSGSMNVFQLPLGPIHIPNIINIGPSFSVKVSANAKCNENTKLSTGLDWTAPPFDVELFHSVKSNQNKNIALDENSMKMGHRKYSPTIKTKIISINSIENINVIDSFNVNGDFNFQANFTIAPTLNLGISLFNQDIAHGASLKLENEMFLKASFDESCPKNIIFGIYSKSSIWGSLGDLNGTISTINQNDLSLQCI